MKPGTGVIPLGGHAPPGSSRVDPEAVRAMLAMKKLIVASIAVLLLLPSAAGASHSFSPEAHWVKTGPGISVDVGDCLRQTYWRRAVRAAIADWSRSPVVTYRLVGCNAPHREFQIRDGFYGPTGWSGYAKLNYDLHFTSVPIKLNSSYGAGFSEARRRKTACHELGHALGLAHRTSGSCLVRGDYPRSRPSRHDYDYLEQIYRHEDSPLTPDEL